ncbi:MAG: Na(+)/H(+) antiporter subunit C [Burkholderiaceae bacterium]|nr:Na(+)/H(+) antiporter subunit C [Microbacteriaceae bacterium]
MSVSLVLVVLMAVLYASGVYLMLEKSLTRVLLGFLLVGNATNLLLLIMAGRAGLAPIVGGDVTPEQMTDPLPQALILTAIVITFGVSAFLMALLYRSWRLSQGDSLEDDADDVAMRRRGDTSIANDEADSAPADSEFGADHADAPSATARGAAPDGDRR